MKEICRGLATFFSSWNSLHIQLHTALKEKNIKGKQNN